MFRLARLGLRLTPGAEGGSAEENQELFSELEEGEGSTLRNESRKQECIYFPCQKGVGARDGDHSQKNPHNFRGLVAIFIFSSHWFPVVDGRSVRKRDEPAEPRDEPAKPTCRQVWREESPPRE